MGLFDNAFNNAVNYLAKKLAIAMGDQNSAYAVRSQGFVLNRTYRTGAQKEPLKVRHGQANDNQITNFIRLIVDEQVSFLFGKEIKFDYGENAEAQEYIDAVWERNKKPVLLHNVGDFGATCGECFIKIVPVEDGLPRLIAQDPLFIDMQTDPDDIENVLRYEIKYVVEVNGKDVTKTEVTEKQTNGTWMISNYEQTEREHTPRLIKQFSWDYLFPPIKEWQNLPAAGDLWGEADITKDIIQLQDKYNEKSSNENKIIRLYAHPQRWSKFFSFMKKKLPNGGEEDDSVNMGPDSMPNSNNEKAEINQLEPAGDLNAVGKSMETTRKAMFDNTRTVDVTTLTTNSGEFTNFRLRVVYQNMLAKNETKRQLYGYALKEINARLLELAGMKPAECKIVWSDPLPENKKEDSEVIAMHLSNGLVSKQTASEKLGYTWENGEKELIAEQSTQEDNLGSTILRAFDRNGGVNT